MNILPNTVLKNRYRIIEMLGKGGMGVVYLAYDNSLEQKCAVKINFGNTEQSTSQFLREARLLASLRHPNLPRVIDYFLLENNQYLVMDYVPGKDLGEILNEGGIQPVEKVIDWARQLISALSYLHQQNPPIIHRDIKPANIKVTPTGEVMLVDFGIAKAVDLTQSTVTGARGYTPGYAPPEQYGTTRTGPYSDQYSLAATLFRLMTGENPAESMQRILKQANLVSVQHYNPRVPPNIAEAIERALSIRPEERFANVEAFGNALTDPNFRYQTSAAAMQKADNLPTRTMVSAPPLASPRKRISAWVWIGLLTGVILLGVVALGIGYALLSDRLAIFSPKASPTVVVAAEQPDPSETPTIQDTAASTPTLTETIQPTGTQSPSQTVAPTETFAPTVTPTEEPTATTAPIPVGGEGLVAFVSDRGEGGVKQIWTLRVGMDNSRKIFTYDLTQLTFDEGDKSHLAWSPDGKNLLYSAPGKSAENGLELFMIDTTDLTKPPFQVTDRKGDDVEASWSPDGNTIAFVNNGREDKIRQIYFIDPQGQNLRRISFDYEEYSPEWSPDGASLLFVIPASDHQIIFIRTRSDDFTSLKTYDRTSHFGRLGNVDDIAFSPDANFLAYMEIVTSRQLDVCNVLYSSGGGEVNTLTQNSDIDRQPDWSRDSQWIVFTSERDGNPEIYIMELSGLDQTNLSNHPGQDLFPAWQP